MITWIFTLAKKFEPNSHSTRKYRPPVRSFYAEYTSSKNEKKAKKVNIADLFGADENNSIQFSHLTCVPMKLVINSKKLIFQRHPTNFWAKRQQ